MPDGVGPVPSLARTGPAPLVLAELTTGDGVIAAARGGTGSAFPDVGSFLLW
ncbi:hypothetical protein M3148_00320 [Georgenia satyanarayanai]|uniref:hypothetical protein n=1 Tax=Georgenia satyanarayanai TaxID=860221 RepID=UPI00204167FF|nr:hypothetical protein [Georgenia satyanarayanai]MCM3659446.1 hypothetical protein [Georgenia satyanarayanai]